jgi:hypothetical protein
MGKKKKSNDSAPAAPAFTPSQVMIGNRVVGQTYMGPDGNIVTQYFESPEEIERRRISDQKINQILPTLGQTAPELGQRYDTMMNDYVSQQTDLFNRDYDKSLRGLREDIGSRFGTLKATPYFDKLQDLEKNVKAPAMLEIQRQGSMYRKDLDDQEQGRKLTELGALGYQLNTAQQNFLSGLQSPLTTATLMNNFNQNRYSQQLQGYNQELARRQNSTNRLLSFIGGL